MTEKEHFFWNKLLELAKEELTQATFDYYVLDTKLIKVQDNVATILLEEVKKLFWEKNMQSFILMAGFEAYNSEIKVEYVFDEALLNEANSTVTNNDFGNKKEQQTPALPTLDSDLNSKYTFDNFIQGDENRWSVAASLAVADSPGATYNPLFIYGGVGLGKTHLMHAIGHQVIKNNPNSNVLYVTSEKFTNQLINAIKDNKNEQFRNKYRNIDVLLIDDIQFIAGKERIQEEFFHTFNTLHDNRKQIVISSDRPPKDIPLLEDRLKSRFEWGLIADISIPDYETRLAILRKKAQTDNIIVDDVILSTIATRVASNIRELEGVFNKLVAFSTLANGPITIEMAEKAINDISAQKEKVISADYIQDVVAKYFNINKKDLKSSKRSNDIAYPRQIAMYLCREVAGLSFPKIGEEFGKRDHTTVMHGCNKIEKEIKENTNTKLIVESVKKIILEKK